MPRRPIHKMPPEQRAKQFAPFRALVGLEEALAAMEETTVRRPILSEESASELNLQLLLLESCLSELMSSGADAVGIPVEVTWYQKGHIHKNTGKVDRMDLPHRYLYWDQSDPLYFDDLLSLTVDL